MNATTERTNGTNGSTAALAVLKPQSNELGTHLADDVQIMPAVDIDDMLRRHNLLLKFRDSVLKEDRDYGKIPGTNDKLTLLKPGAEKLCTYFGLVPRLEVMEKVEDWDGVDHKGEPFFYYWYRFELYCKGRLVAQGDGSCNSREAKYRWRKGERVCPSCNQPTIFKSKEEYGGGFYCNGKKGGCGVKYKANDPAIVTQEVGRVLNPDVFDQVNTIQKMAIKRAHIAATLQAINVSDFFVGEEEANWEDAPSVDYVDAEHSAAPPAPQRSAQQPAQSQPAPSQAPQGVDPEYKARGMFWQGHYIGKLPSEVPTVYLEKCLTIWADKGAPDQTFAASVKRELERRHASNATHDFENPAQRLSQGYAPDDASVLDAESTPVESTPAAPASNGLPDHIKAIWAKAREKGAPASSNETPAQRDERLTRTAIMLTNRGFDPVDSFSDLDAPRAWEVCKALDDGWTWWQQQ